MSLVNYSEIANPASSKDVLNRIRTFALAQGWTVDDYQTSVEWVWTGSKYEWQAASSPDDNDFLQLYSNGYGSQTVILRLRAWSLTHGTYPGRLDFRATQPGYRTPNDASSTWPGDQNYAAGSSQNYRQPLAPSTMPKMWLFGNDKFICVVVQTQTEVVQCFYMGLIEMFNTSRSDGFIVVASSYWDGQWYGYDQAATVRFNYHLTPFDYFNYGVNGWYMIWNESRRDGHAWQVNCKFSTGDGLAGYFNQLAIACKANAFTGKRVLIKPTVFFRRVSDSVWEPSGTYPCYRLNQAGLGIGDIITYGSEEYIVFPNTFPTRIYGYAFRIT